MLSFNIIASLASLCLTASAVAIPDPKRIQSLPLVGRADAAPIGAVLYNSPFKLLIYVGSNKTEKLTQLDTGSADLFVEYYDYENSTGYSSFNKSFNTFLGANRVGNWLQDDTSFGDGPTVPLGLGVQNENDTVQSLFGAHFLEGYAPNYIRVLRSEGHINKATFSIWYDHPATQGQILFGSYDKAKYSGVLSVNNLTHVDEGSWNIPTGGIITPDGQLHFYNQSATLDTGNGNIYLPEDQLRELSASLNGSTYEEDGNYISYPTCNFTDDQKLEFAFGEAKVEINLRLLSYSYAGKCALLFHIGDPVYGAPFTSNAFTLFDLEDKTISIANRVYTNDTDIQIIE